MKFNARINFEKNYFVFKKLRYKHVFYFNHLMGWRCCVDRTVPEAIHNPVAIKLLLFGLLT